MNFIESYVEFSRNNMVYVVEDLQRALHFYRSPQAANDDFAGAFDIPDDEDEGDAE
jgi:hypothetical protein